MGYWEPVGPFRCSCGTACEEWHDHTAHRWRVRHGVGEAVFVIDFDTLIAEMGEAEGSYKRWLAQVHEYEACRADATAPR